MRAIRFRHFGTGPGNAPPTDVGGTAINLATANIVCDGNSQTQGPTTSGDPDAFPTILAGLLGRSSSGVTNLGLGGQTTRKMRGLDGGSEADVIAAYNPALQNVLICSEVRNQITLGGTNPDVRAMVTDFWTYCDARRAQGYLVIVWDILPTNGSSSSGLDAIQFNSALHKARQYIQAEWHLHAEGYFDPRADSRLYSVTGPGVGYWVDVHHPNAAGYALMAQMAFDAIGRLRVGATIRPGTVAKRIRGIAPLKVFFDGTNATVSGVANTFRDVEHRWRFGETAGPGIGVWNTGLRAGYSSRNRATGPVAGHVFETPGTYAVEHDVISAGTIATETVYVTVQDPDVEFAGALTAVVSSTGNWAGKPSGATQISSSDWAATYTAQMAAGVRRLLFCRGETFGALGSRIVMTTPGPGIIGSYGTGAKPVYTPPVGNVAGESFVVLSSATTAGLNDWVWMDGKFDASSRENDYFRAFVTNGGFDRFTMLRLDFWKCTYAYVQSDDALDGFNNLANPLRSTSYPTQGGHRIWDQWAFVDNTIAGAVDAPLGSPGTAAYPYGTYGCGQHMLYEGNLIDLSASDLRSSHCARQNYSFKVAIGNNTVLDPGGDRLGLKLCNVSYDCDSTANVDWTPAPKKLASDPTNAGGGGTRFVYIADNQWGALNSASKILVSISPPAPDTDGRGKDVLFERNWLYGGPSVIVAMQVSWSDVTVRNNVVDMSASVYAEGIRLSTEWITTDAMKPAVSPSTGPAPDGVRIYNNTFYCGTNRVFNAINFNDATPTNVDIRNNLAYAPLAASLHVMIYETGGAPAAYINSNNSTTAQIGGVSQLDPQFIGPLNAVSGFAVWAGSYANNAGATVQVWSDIVGTARPTGAAPDLGAFEQ